MMKKIKPIHEKHLEFNPGTMLAMGIDGSQIIPFLHNMDAELTKIYADNTLTPDAKILKSYTAGKKLADFALTNIAAGAVGLDAQVAGLKKNLHSSKLKEKALSQEQIVLLPNVVKSYDPEKGISKNESQQRMLLSLEQNGIISGISGNLDREYTPDTVIAIADTEKQLVTMGELLNKVKNYVHKDLNENLALEIQSRKVD